MARRIASRSFRSSRRQLLVEALETRTVPDGLSLVSHWNHADPGHYYSDLWAEGNFVYLGHLGEQQGVDIVDISDPQKPIFAANFRGVGGDTDIQDLHVQNGIGYFSSDTDGSVYVVDLSDPYNPRQLSRISPEIGGAKNVHTLSVEGDYLYEATTRTNDIHVFNISDPRNPRFVRIITSPSKGPVHEVTALGGRLYTAVIYVPGAVDVFDIRNVEVGAPLLGSFQVGNVAHTSWPIGEGQYLAVAREERGGDVEIWDIQDLATPLLVSRIGLPESEAWSAHQVMTLGSWLYVSWYQAGVRIYDVSDPTAPLFLADYDTHPEKVAGFSGSWGVYPYLGLDRVLVIDIDRGLFILAHTGSAPGSPPPDQAPSVGQSGLSQPARSLPPLHSRHSPGRDSQAAHAGVAHHLTGLLAAAGTHPALLPGHQAGTLSITEHRTAVFTTHVAESSGSLDYGHIRTPLWHNPG